MSEPILLIGSGGYLGYILNLRSSDQNLPIANVSSSFHWSLINTECIVSHARNIPHELLKSFHKCVMIYMAGSTDLAQSNSSSSSDLTQHIGQLQDFFNSLKSLSITPSKLIFFSSAGTVYGESHGVPQEENSLLRPISVYGVRNMLSESLVAANCYQLNIPFSCFRISNPYGPSQHLFKRKGLIYSLASSCFNNNVVTLRSGGLQHRDYIYEEDFCDIVLSLLKLHSLPPYLNICTGITYSALDIIDLFRQYGCKPSYIITPHYDSHDVFKSKPSNQLLSTILHRSTSSPITKSRLLSLFPNTNPSVLNL